MLYLLGLVFFFFIALVLIGLSILTGVFRTISGLFRSGNQENQTRKPRMRQTHDAPARQKMFDKDEGEYVDFEEVKEEEG